MAAAVLGMLLVIALGRLVVGVALGRRWGPAAPVLPLFLVLAAVQLDAFILQETLETIVARGALDAGFLWGLAWSGFPVQVALALLAAHTLRWLSVRFRSAVGALRLFWRCRGPRPLLLPAIGVTARPSPEARPGDLAFTVLTGRGPPLLSRP